MGNAAYRIKKTPPRIPSSNASQFHHGTSDNGSHAHGLTTTNAPWNVTQWIDPYDPHPKVTSMPMILIIRK